MNQAHSWRRGRTVSRPCDRFARLRRLALATTGLVFLCAAGPAEAASHALLIGVADYENPSITKLKGPRNDVTLLWRVLTRDRGFAPENVIVLADGLPTAADVPVSKGNPKRAAILAALADLGAKAKSGDMVVIYYSGHGTEQPVLDLSNDSQDPERGNLDQVMLPMDAGDYSEADKGVRNGIVDDDIGKALDVIRSKGADVWMIIDACHAGTMTRGEVEGQAVRGIAPRALGIPAPPANSGPIKTRDNDLRRLSVQKVAPKGSLVGFFAVDSSTEAIERPFPSYPPLRGDPKNNRMGVFTHFLIEALKNDKAQTYRELAQLIVQSMRRTADANPPPMPTFDGSLERPILGSGPSPVPSGWLAEVKGEEIIINGAGKFHGLTEGTVVKLTDGPKPDAPVIQRAVITSADAARAVGKLMGTATGPLPAQPRARIDVPAVSFQLAVALPPAEEASDDTVRRVIEEVRKRMEERGMGAIDWVPAKSPSAHVHLRVADGRIWLVPADGEWVQATGQYGQTPAIPLPSPSDRRVDRTVDSLIGKLHLVTRANSLVRLAGTAQEQDALAGKLEVTAERIPAPGGGPTGDSKRACPALNTWTAKDRAAATRIEPTIVAGGDARRAERGLPQIYHCDLVTVTVKNTGPRDMDVGIAYIDSGSGINSLGRECTINLPAGQTVTRSAWVTTWNARRNTPDSVGREHIMVTAVERGDDGIEANLCFVQDSTRAATRSAAGSAAKGGWLAGALAKAATGGRTRSVTPDAAAFASDDAGDAAPESQSRAGASVRLFSFAVTPPRDEIVERERRDTFASK